MIKIVLRSGAVVVGKRLTLGDVEAFAALARRAGASEKSLLQVNTEGIVFQTEQTPVPVVAGPDPSWVAVGTDEPPF